MLLSCLNSVGLDSEIRLLLIFCILRNVFSCRLWYWLVSFLVEIGV